MKQRTVERQCTCSNWMQRANDAFFPVWFDAETSEYVLERSPDIAADDGYNEAPKIVWSRSLEIVYAS